MKKNKLPNSTIAKTNGPLLQELQRQHEREVAAHVTAARAAVQAGKPSGKFRWAAVLRRDRRALEAFVLARSRRTAQGVLSQGT